MISHFIYENQMLYGGRSPEKFLGVRKKYSKQRFFAHASCSYMHALVPRRSIFVIHAGSRLPYALPQSCSILLFTLEHLSSPSATRLHFRPSSFSVRPPTIFNLRPETFAMATATAGAGAGAAGDAAAVAVVVVQNQLNSNQFPITLFCI